VKAEKENTRAGHQEKVSGKLHQSLGEKQVQLVGVVVDPRNQVSGLVLIEECDGQGLEAGEESISKIEEHMTPYRAHPLSLEVARAKADQVDAQQKQRGQQDTIEIPVLNVNVDGARDDERTQKASC